MTRKAIFTPSRWVTRQKENSVININLLPEDFKKKPAKSSTAAIPFSGKFAFLSRFSLKTLLIAGASALVGVVLLALILVLLLPTAMFQSKLKYIDERSSAIRKDVELATRMEKEEEELKKIVFSMEKLESDRVLWARLLNDLSDATPPEIRLTRMYQKEEEIKVEAPKKEAVKEKPKAKKEEPAAKGEEKDKTEKKEKKPKRPKKEAAQKKKVRYLMLEGMLEAGRDEGVVNSFIESLKGTPYFSTLFSDISLVGISILPDGKKAGTIRCHYKEIK